MSGGGGGVGQSRLKPSGSWTAAKKRTWPVCPWPRPVGLRGARGQLTALGEVGMVSTTPALVPTHSSSSHTSSAVILRQAALCCRMMASEPRGQDGPELGLSPGPGSASSIGGQKGSRGKGQGLGWTEVSTCQHPVHGGCDVYFCQLLKGVRVVETHVGTAF